VKDEGGEARAGARAVLAGEPSHASPAAAPRVVLIGASNLSLAFPEVLACARALWPGPLEVLAAHGLGRSYGLPTRVLGRELPAISACGLWRALEAPGSGPTFALLTDLGNDIAYEVPVERIEEWVRAAVRRLEDQRARIVVTRPPLASIETARGARFHVVRTLLFRARPITYDYVRESAIELDRRLCALARERGLELVTPAAGAYGWDRIHLRARERTRFFGEALLRIAEGRLPAEMPRLASEERRNLRRLRPEWERHLGREHREPQPAGRLADGSTIALY
jgi:hypothetical protein